MKPFKFFLLITTITFLQQAAVSQITVSTSTKLKSEALNCYSKQPFDTKVETLPVDFRGNDLKSILDEILKRDRMAKDEFETTKQFTERMQLVKQRNFYGELNNNSLFSFVISEGDFKYDADNTEMNYTAMLTPAVKWLDLCSTTAYSRYSNYLLNISKFGQNHFPIHLKFKVEIEKAKKTKPNLRTLIIGKLKEIDGKLFKSTSSYSDYLLNFEAINLWIYDIVTGEVYFKLKPDDFEKIYQEAKDRAGLNGGQYSQVKLLYENNNDDDALLILRRILVSEPMDARAYYWVGKIHYRQNNINQAIQSLKTALFWDNGIVEANLMLSEIYLEKGDCLQSQNYARLASELEPENKEIIKLISRIEKCGK